MQRLPKQGSGGVGERRRVGVGRPEKSDSPFNIGMMAIMHPGPLADYTCIGTVLIDASHGSDDTPAKS